MHKNRNICTALFLAALLTFTFDYAWAGCTNPDGDEGAVIYNKDEKVAQFCDGLDWWSMKSSGGNSNKSVINCPSDFSRIGPPGEHTSYCISIDEQSSATFFNAHTACQNMSTGGAHAYLCTNRQWYTACVKGVDTGETALNNMTDDREWVDDFAGDPDSDYDMAVVKGDGSCNAITYGYHSNGSGGGLSNTAVYRCCYN